MNPEDVRYIAVEGGGAGGLLIHPGVLEALETLQIVRTEGHKPAGVRSWSGSSSGSIISTLVSVGYAAWEIALLAGQEAFDMVFRLETIQQGEFAGIPGTCIRPMGGGTAVEPSIPTAVANAIQQSDPAGSLADLLHMSRLMIGLYIENSQAVYGYFKQEQLERLNAVLQDSQSKRVKRFEALAGEVSYEYALRQNKWLAPPAKVLTFLEKEFPYLVAALAGLISAQAAGKVKGPSIFQILKRDFGLSSGCVWRDYIDHLIAFARFRLRYGSELPGLELPRVADMKVVKELAELFHDAIDRAVTAAFGSGDPPQDYFQAYIALQRCTFAQHAAEFYDWLGASSVPPLIISGANITTQESHLFSAHASPDFQVADAVRMATGLPPVFKPVMIGPGDIPAGWPQKKDRFGTGHYLEGLWVDGGLYYNAPFEVFAQASTAFSGEQNTLGIGAGLQARVGMNNLTQFAAAFINMGYEANVSATRMDLANYLNINKFAVGFAKPRVMPKALEYYRLDAYWRTFQFFGLDPGF